MQGSGRLGSRPSAPAECGRSGGGGGGRSRRAGGSGKGLSLWCDEACKSNTDSFRFQNLTGGGSNPDTNRMKHLDLKRKVTLDVAPGLEAPGGLGGRCGSRSRRGGTGGRED